jgi:hypothetical protein
VRQQRSSTSHSCRSDDSDDINCLRQESHGPELRCHLTCAETSCPQPKSHAGNSDCNIKHFAGTADGPDLPTFSALRCSSAQEFDASYPDVPSSLKQALSSHNIDESPFWLPSDVQSKPQDPLQDPLGRVEAFLRIPKWCWNLAASPSQGLPKLDGI